MKKNIGKKLLKKLKKNAGFVLALSGIIGIAGTGAYNIKKVVNDSYINSKNIVEKQIILDYKKTLNTLDSLKIIQGRWDSFIDDELLNFNHYDGLLRDNIQTMTAMGNDIQKGLGKKINEMSKEISGLGENSVTIKEYGAYNKNIRKEVRTGYAISTILFCVGIFTQLTLLQIHRRRRYSAKKISQS